MKGFNKISGIYFDTKPIEGSNNAVTSNGIVKAIKEGSYDDTELRNRITQAESDIDSLETDVETITNNVNKIRIKQRDSNAVVTRTFRIPSTTENFRYKVTYSSQLYNTTECFYGEWIISNAGTSIGIVEIFKSSNITFSYENGVVTVSTPFTTAYGCFTCETL